MTSYIDYLLFPTIQVSSFKIQCNAENALESAIVDAPLVNIFLIIKKRFMNAMFVTFSTKRSQRIDQCSRSKCQTLIIDKKVTS